MKRELDALVEGRHTDPHHVLGPHVEDGRLTIRAMWPHASLVELVIGEDRYPMEHEHRGIWIATLDSTVVPDYRLAVTFDGGTSIVAHDPYRFAPTLGELDLHLIAEGRHENLWHVLGSHVYEFDTDTGPVSGVAFAVWAPNAQGVSVVGDFNVWDGSSTPMRQLGGSGIWEVFIPDIADGARYKYEVLGFDGVRRLKADPFATATELPPGRASIVHASKHEWGDAEWLERRAQTDPYTSPMSVYEVHLGSWMPGLGYRELAEPLLRYVTEQGFTHVEFLPVMEHPFGGSWGYQITSYYAPSSRYGDPDDLRYLIDQLHQAGIGVFLDWVPGHFPRDSFALAKFDGTTLYEHPNPQRGEHPDWGTLIFDFGRSEVRNFLFANALYWCEEFHADGLRVDAVSSMIYLDYSREPHEWTPNIHGGRENLEAVAFLQEMNATLYRRVPGVITMAEEATAWPGVSQPVDVGGLGFGFKWNMGWMHDSLDYVEHDIAHRPYHHDQFTFSLVYAWSEKYVLPISHDEVVHGKGSLLRKMPGDHWQRLANLRTYFACMWAHPGKQLLFMGSEFGQEAEWSEERGTDWYLLQLADHQGAQAVVRDANRIYRQTPALWELDTSPEGFAWLDADDTKRSVFSWVRFDAKGGSLVCVANYSAEPYYDYPVGLPAAGMWTETLNTDSVHYGGSGVGNLGQVKATVGEFQGQPASARITVPPLGAVWLVPA